MDPELVYDTHLLAPSQEYLASIKVFPLIPTIKREVLNTIDSPLSWAQLTASDVNFSIVRPLVFKFARLKNLAVVYACLVVKSYFMEEAENSLAYAGVNLSRAGLCELLAMKLLAHFASDHMQLVAVLTTSWNPLAGASEDIVSEIRQNLGGNDDDLNYPQSALEMAISTESKSFLASPVTQKVVNDIYSGRVVYSITATRTILADNYKHRGIQIYDWRSAPFLDHYRLRVPRYKNALTFLNFALLLVTFALCLSYQNVEKVTVWEVVFCVFAFAFTLDEYTAATEHGWIIYIANMWNVFDFGFILIFIGYAILRVRGLAYDHVQSSEMAFDVLACGACILFPRLAFVAISNTIVVISLRAMISEFVFFIGVAAICFSGLLFTLWTLSKDNDRWTLGSIAWLMVQIWFGNTYLSFGQAESFHPFFGPILMTMFAALSGTLLLTILISILSNVVARIDANATQEYLFQHTLTVIEGVKADALFSYQPPFNILAFVLLKPASWIVSPRALHSLNVLLIRLTSFPILVAIAIYERYLASGQRLRESGKGAAHTFFHSLPRHIKHMPIVEALVGSTSADLYGAIFDLEIDHDFELFDNEAEERPLFPPPRDDVRTPPSPTARRRPSSLFAPRREQHSPIGSPRRRVLTNLDTSAEVLAINSRSSPLARLFTRTTTAAPENSAAVEASIKRLETIVDSIKDSPIQRLKEEMKELQDRQARIENLLLVLTRGMRNDSSG
ncbi:hypothetical protein K435DRAFT_829719 [Dendrothele bispora CBS 962.96]|uniref:Receptor-activated Ca2+-permeable cation channel n=1 Tax=Dendrothele bispora (strain CBS 962.96) TaxID=1314807 RepID=A0A4S8LRW5_DENBC|nr:hypothetical protein K435DRAFT_830909 [Dendrothele bispora CBS 962.96]THU92206.1 hypothetical protein K435DRAFT_829719 [Dendrothele bispora CBS 962.96]